MEQTASFGYWLRRRRKALDLTQDALARQAGCALGTLKKIETDERRPSRQLAERLADCLAIPAAERAAFVQAARAELATDRLAMITQPIEQNDADTALPSPTARSNNLPAQPNTLIGREREIADVVALLRDDDVRLLTLTGPGGTGKTRLALQAAAELALTPQPPLPSRRERGLCGSDGGEGQFPDGVWFVNLAPIRDPALVLPSIAQALGVIELPGQPIEQRLKAYLHAKQLLLLLDNFEQVIDAAPLVAELLAAAPGLKVLVTSRATLHIYGEHEYAVPPLALPPAVKATEVTERTEIGRPLGNISRNSSVFSVFSVADLTQYESVRLFIARARAAKADFAVTNDSAPAVAEICHRLDGLPLAIELAAARIKLFPPEALLARLDHSLQVLTGGPRDLPARQQTLRNAIDWSYNLLDESEQALFRRLGVFVGGCTLAAAEAVASEGKRQTANGKRAEGDTSFLPFTFELLPLLESLIDKSLLRQEAGPDGEPRFVMLETVREYALERLEERGEAEEMRRRHAGYFVALTEQASPELLGSEQAVWLNRLEREIDNLRAVFAWSLAAPDTADVGIRLAVALEPFGVYAVMKTSYEHGWVISLQ